MVSQKEAVRRRGVDIVTPPMDAGTAVIYSYTTQHRGLASSRPDFYRPVLKLDYFGSFVQKNNNKDVHSNSKGMLTVEGERTPKQNLSRDQLVVRGRGQAGSKTQKAHVLRSTVVATPAWRWRSRCGLIPHRCLKAERWVTSRRDARGAARCDRCSRGPDPQGCGLRPKRTVGSLF